ncbi:MAG: redoxin domain-containing protein [Gemmatimonadaceae bacterium]
MSTSASTTAPQAGAIAPDFTLASTSGQPVTLSSLRGKENVLLAFFPFAFSSVCTAEFCEMRDNFDQFTSHDVRVFPISVDSTYALKEFKAKYGMQVDLLSDFKREVSTKYGTLIPDKFFSNRAYFLIDKQGVIRWAHLEDSPGSKRENSEVMAEISKLA